MRELSPNPDKHRRADDYALGTPDGYAKKDGDVPLSRSRLVLDDVVEKAIGKLPAATRLYPEVYAWHVTDAILEYIERKEQ